MSEFDRLVEREVRRYLTNDRELLIKDIRAELLSCEWLDQGISILGRNRHVKLARRLIGEGSADALYTDDGKWMVRREAVSREIARLNRDEPPACATLTPLPPKMPPLAKAEAEPEDETGIYERSLLERVRGRL